jgi:hypothetical protein
MLMLFCALLLLITQYQFSSAQKLLQNRRTRAFEPDFTGAKATFTGPAQAMLKRTGTTVAMASGIKEKAKQVSSIAFSVIIVIFFTVLSRAQELLRSFSPFSGASGRMFMLIGMAILTVVMVIHVLRKAKTGGTATLIPRVVSCVACAAGTIFLALGQVEDLLYYACAAAMLAAACWELVIINRAHNEYASRPVPFFGEEAAS